MSLLIGLTTYVLLSVLAALQALCEGLLKPVLGLKEAITKEKASARRVKALQRRVCVQDRRTKHLQVIADAVQTRLGKEDEIMALVLEMLAEESANLSQTRSAYWKVCPPW